MKRRTFIGLIAGAVAWPLASRAQKQPTVIGWLGSGSGRSSQTFVDSLKQGLGESDLKEGRDFVLDLRWAEGRYDRFPLLAKELLADKVDIIVATTISAVRAAQQATSTVPIVMTSITDAVGAGLVASLAHPGGNTTGISNLNEDLTPKLIDFLRELLPAARKIAAIANPRNPSTDVLFRSLQTNAGSFGASVTRFEIPSPSATEAIFELIPERGFDVIVVVPDAALIDLREALASNAVKRHIPMISTIPELTDAGALMGYGPPRRELHRRAGFYIKRIIAGAKPSELPVEQPQLIELSINSKTASILGIRIPNGILVRADRVVE